MSVFLVRIEPFGAKSKRCRLVVEGADNICLYHREIAGLGWKEGDEIPSEEYLKVIRDVLVPRARQRALYLLERQDRTGSGLRDKLAQSGYPDSVIETVVSGLSEMHYIDDERFVRRYIDCHKTDRSRRRLKDDLINKGIERDMASYMLDELYDTEESDIIINLLEKRRYDREKADEKQRSKMFRYLCSRGFDYDAVRELI